MQVFAYGQTGAGKTYVMGTAATRAQLGSPREERGVVPRGINYLFSKMPQLRQHHMVTLRVRATLRATVALSAPALHYSTARLIQAASRTSSPACGIHWAARSAGGVCGDLPR